MKRADMAVINDMVRRYAESGLTVAEASANLGLHIYTVSRYARLLGVKFVHGSKKTTPDARAVAMRDAYLAGRTLEQIGAEYSISRERVRQIITKHFGRLSAEGGISVQGRQTRAQRIAALEQASLRKWGCTRKQYKVLLGMGRKLMLAGVNRARTPIGAYCMQRQNAERRKIEWKMTLWEWWTIWQKSGKWSRRGRERGRFVMCRKGDTGPYSADNVFIALACENISEATRQDDLPIGVYRRAKRFGAKTIVRGRPVNLGTFDTPEEAHIAYLRALHLEAA